MPSLLHQPHQVRLTPEPSDLPILHTEDFNTGHDNRLSGWRETHKLPVVYTPSGKSACNLIATRHQVIDGYVQAMEGSPAGCDDVVYRFNPGAGCWQGNMQ